MHELVLPKLAFSPDQMGEKDLLYTPGQPIEVSSGFHIEVMPGEFSGNHMAIYGEDHQMGIFFYDRQPQHEYVGVPNKDNNIFTFASPVTENEEIQFIFTGSPWATQLSQFTSIYSSTNRNAHLMSELNETLHQEKKMSNFVVGVSDTFENMSLRHFYAKNGPAARSDYNHAYTAHISFALVANTSKQHELGLSSFLIAHNPVDTLTRAHHMGDTYFQVYNDTSKITECAVRYISIWEQFLRDSRTPDIFYEDGLPVLYDMRIWDQTRQDQIKSRGFKVASRISQNRIEVIQNAVDHSLSVHL